MLSIDTAWAIKISRWRDEVSSIVKIKQHAREIGIWQENRHTEVRVILHHYT